LEQQNKRRTRMKIGVSCVLGVGVLGLMGMLVQGCNNKHTPEETPAPAPDITNTVPGADTNPPPTEISNQPPVTASTNPVAAASPIQQPAPAPIPVATPPPAVTPEVAGGEYTVAKGDSLAKIAKKNGVSLKALQAANPTVKPTKLKVGQKLALPAGGKTAAEAAPAAATAGTAAETSGESYTVKSGDTLTKIAKAHGVKVKALMAANGLTTANIKVGKKLTIPGKTEAPAAPAAAPVTPPTADTAPTPAAPVAPAAAPAPAPGHN
jgi:LysM repeat protein